MYWRFNFNKKSDYRGRLLSKTELKDICSLKEIKKTFLLPENLINLNKFNPKGKGIIKEVLNLNARKQKKLLRDSLLETNNIPIHIAEVISSVNRKKLNSNINYQHIANLNCVVPIEGTNALFSPWLLAYIIKYLNIKEQMNVCVFGIGNGYVLNVISEIVGKKGKVTGVEINPQYIQKVKKSVKQNVVLINDNVFNYKSKENYDVILTTLSVTDIPKNWINMLKVNGKMCLFYKKSNKDSCLLIGDFNSNKPKCEIMNDVYNLPFQNKREYQLKSFNEIEFEFPNFMRQFK